MFVSISVLFLNSIVATNFAQDAGISDDSINFQNEKDDEFDKDDKEKDEDDKEWENDDESLKKHKAFVKEMNEKALKIVLDWIKNLNRDEFKVAMRYIAEKNKMTFDFKEKEGFVFDYLGLEKEYFEVDNLEFSFIPKLFELISYQCSKKDLSEVVTEICGNLNYVFPQIEGVEKYVICNFDNISRMRILHSILDSHGYKLYINNIEYLYEQWISDNFRLDISLEFLFDVIWRLINEMEEEIYEKLRKIYKNTLSENLTDEIAVAHMIIENEALLTGLFLEGINLVLKERNEKNYILTIQLPY